MAVTLDWLGTATFRLTIDDTVLFLDGYIERVPGAAPIGLSLADIDRCDYILVGHSHFDHLWGVDVIANATGARVIGSYESIRMLAEAGVGPSQLIPVAGGEPVRLKPDIRVRVFPSLHTCLWCMGSEDDPTMEHTGDLDVDQHDRDQRVGQLISSWLAEPDLVEHVLSGPHARGDGGPLVYLIETRHGSVFWQDSAGAWTNLLATLRPDIALLAAVGRPNRDGDPYQGSLARFVTDEIELLRAGTVALCHHDAWMPPATPALPIDPFAAEIARRVLPATLLDLAYLEGRQIL